jgi:type VI secretion system protein ImpE
MTKSTAAEEALRQGDAANALKLLTEQVRAHPQDAKLRVFLFQLLVVLGQWERALNQLKVASELDASTLAMAQTYREAIHCETLRLQVFAGQKVPMLFGEPETWVALLIEALLREGRGDHAAAAEMRARALDEAPATAGTLDNIPFEWIADADGRLGPTLEAVVNGRYYWVPFNRLQKVILEAPVDLRDAVWMPAHLVFSNGGDTVALIPTRYPDTELSSGDAHALSRATSWRESPHGAWTGIGQRIIATSANEVALMDIRSIALAAD